MEADERKPGEIMIELDLLPPRGFVVTLLAAQAKFALMSVVFLVASNAGSRWLGLLKT